MATEPRKRTRARQTSRTIRYGIGIAAATLTLASCASAPEEGGTAASGATESLAPVTDEQVADVIRRAFLDDIPMTDLDPAIQQTMKVAAQPWTDAMQSKLDECMSKDVCETGRGSLTVAFPNDNIGPWRQTFRAEMTAQAIATPEVGKIIYSLGTDTASWLANFKSLVAQQPDVIVMDSIFGSAIAPAVSQAKAAGITVVQAETPLPPEVADLVDVQATSDLCGAYTQGVEAVTELVPESSTYGVYTGVPGNASAADWQPCLTQGLDDAGWTKSNEGFTQWTPQGMTSEGNALFASGEDPDVVAYDYTMEYFANPFLDAGQAPPIMMSDAINYAYLKNLQDAQEAGVPAKAFVANSRVWQSRIGLTAGVMKATGEDVAKQVDIPYPMVDADTLLEFYDPAMPANAPVPTLFDADQETAILEAGS